MENGKITRLALHSAFGHVGNFYDAKLDEFIKETQLERFKQFETIEMKENSFNYSVELDEFNERWKRVNMDVEQKWSILSNLTKSQSNGFANFLTTLFEGVILEECTKKPFGIVRIWHKKSSSLNFGDKRIRIPVISQTPLQNATHIVEKVIFGFVVAAVFIPSNKIVKMEELKKAIHSIIMSPNSVTNLQNRYKNILENAGNSVKIHIFADSKLAIPQQLSLNETIELLASKYPFNFDPLPIKYEMIPITHLIKKDYLNESNLFVLRDHDSSFVENFEYSLKTIKSIEAFYEKMANLLEKYPYCFSNELLSSFGEKCTNAKNIQQKYYGILQNCLNSYRNINNMGMAIKLEESSELMEEQEIIDEMNGILPPLFRKIKLAEILKEKGVPYLGNANYTLRKALNSGSKKTYCFVFFFSGDDDLAENSPNRQLFFHLIERGEKCIFADMELGDWAKKNRTTRIAKYRNGQEMVEDYLKEEERKLSSCIVKMQKMAEKFDANNCAPENLVHFECPCPKAKKFGGDGNCPNADCRWECDDCGQFLAIQNQPKKLVDYFYCQCGRIRVEDIQFRCKSIQQHGHEFVPFPREILGSIFEQFNFGEKNILILGESGVGKSTWINAFANYMAYRSMEDALKGNEPICLIPTQFTIADEKLNPKLVKIGQMDENGDEIMKIGQSATQSPKVYKFPYKGGTIRLIDTPGIGDTEGIEEDKAKFASTLSCISNYKELHGICILMKPNNARLSLIFRYCLNELLANLHKNAAKNIIFCFTNTRSTFYRPGDSLSTLKAHLDGMNQDQGVRIELNLDNVFCMDNEAFRFICAAHNKIKFDEKEQANFAESWRHSEAETHRLLTRINSLQSHTADETVSLNEARRIITTLSQPIAIVARMIRDNIVAMTEEQNRLARITETEENLQTLLMIPFFYIDYKILKLPQIICASRKCTEIQIDQNGQQQIHYKTVCQDVCFLRGSMGNHYPNPELQYCPAFNRLNGNCIRCNCPWHIHMNTHFQQNLCVKMVENPHVKRCLVDEKNNKAAIKMAIEGVAKRLQTFEAEQQKIHKIAASFGWFLKRHAIMPYNDAIEAYVEMEISEAQRIADGNIQKIEGLQAYLHKYNEQRRIIDESLETKEINPEKIMKYYHELIGLELMGGHIKELFDAEKIAQKNQMAHFEKSFTPQPPTIFHANKNNEQRKTIKREAAEEEQNTIYISDTNLDQQPSTSAAAAGAKKMNSNCSITAGSKKRAKMEMDNENQAQKTRTFGFFSGPR